ncbi:MAG: hypothetical protein KDI98_02480, partial [Hyphomicrobiaceae bacterium]|nr:hypothetical protein [Hyphomicrobiaceae bacterium]
MGAIITNTAPSQAAETDAASRASGTESFETTANTSEDAVVAHLKAMVGSNWDLIPESVRNAMIEEAKAHGGDQAALENIVYGQLGDFKKMELEALAGKYGLEVPKERVHPRMPSRSGAERDMMVANQLDAMASEAEQILANYGGSIEKTVKGPRGTTRTTSVEAYLYHPVENPRPVHPKFRAITQEQKGPQMTYEEAKAYVAELRADADKALARAQLRETGENTLHDAGYMHVTPDMLSRAQGQEKGLKDASQVYWSPEFGLITAQSNYKPKKKSWFSKAIGIVVTVAVGAILGPAVGGALAGAMGATGAAAGIVSGMVSGTITGLVQGKDLEDALKGSLFNAITGGATNYVTTAVTNGLGITSELGQSLVGDVVSGGIEAAATGKDAGDLILGNVAGTVGGYASNVIDTYATNAGMSDVMADTVSTIGGNIVKDAVNGGDFNPEQIIRDGIASQIGDYANTQITGAIVGDSDDKTRQQIASLIGNAVDSYVTNVAKGKDGDIDQEILNSLAETLGGYAGAAVTGALKGNGTSETYTEVANAVVAAIVKDALNGGDFDPEQALRNVIADRVGDFAGTQIASYVNGDGEGLRGKMAKSVGTAVDSYITSLVKTGDGKLDEDALKALSETLGGYAGTVIADIMKTNGTNATVTASIEKIVAGVVTDAVNGGDFNPENAVRETLAAQIGGYINAQVTGALDGNGTGTRAEIAAAIGKALDTYVVAQVKGEDLSLEDEVVSNLAAIVGGHVSSAIGREIRDAGIGTNVAVIAEDISKAIVKDALDGGDFDPEKTLRTALADRFGDQAGLLAAAIFKDTGTNSALSADVNKAV